MQDGQQVSRSVACSKRTEGVEAEVTSSYRQLHFPKQGGTNYRHNPVLLVPFRVKRIGCVHCG